MFYLSKIVWAAFQPSSVIAILLVLGLPMVARGKRFGLPLLLSATALYLIAGFSPLANWLVIPLERSAKAGAEEKIDGAAGIIVLGGAISRTDESGRVLMSDSAGRMIEALRLAQQRPELPLIFTGGKALLFDSPERETEAELARRFFESFGIAPPRLKLEDRSRNTLENAVFTARLLQPRPDQRWVLVTSAFHMPRAKALFEAQGFRIIPRAGDFRTNSSEDRWRIFSKPSEGLQRLDMAAKEWVGIFVARLRGDIANVN